MAENIALQLKSNNAIIEKTAWISQSNRRLSEIQRMVWSIQPMIHCIFGGHGLKIRAQTKGENTIWKIHWEREYRQRESDWE